MKLVTPKVVMLQLDPENYRTGPASSQPDALAKIVEIQGDKIVEMASDIVELGLSPFDLTAVSPPDTEGFRVVYEGNRRVAALKLLENPSLARNPSVQAKIEKLRPKYLTRPIRELECSEIADRPTAMQWVDRKQGTGLGGRGMDSWGFVANARRRADGGDVDRWLAALNLLRQNGEPMDGVEAAFTQYRIGATIERVLKSPAMFEVLGVRFFTDGKIEFESGGLERGRVLLATIIKDLVAMRPGTNDFYTNEKSAEFLGAYAHLSAKPAPAASGQDTTSRDTGGGRTGASSPSEGGHPPEKETHHRSNGAGSTGVPGSESSKPELAKKEPARSGRVRPPQSQRKTLAPTGVRHKLDIDNERLHELYVSLRKLKVAGHTFVASVMIRVFLDLTLTHFLIESAQPLPDEIRGRGATDWLHQRVKLKDKLLACLSVADPSGASPVYRGARDGLNSQHPHSIYALHDHVHQIELRSPTPESVIYAWDSYHPLFQKLYELLKSK